MAKKQLDDDYLSERMRGFAVQRNYEYDIYEYDGEKRIMKDNVPTEEEWKAQIIQEWKEYGKDAEYFYFIFHDQDMLSLTEPKPLHVHGVIRFENPRRVGAVMKGLGLSRHENCQKVKSYEGAMKYLLHLTDKARQDGKVIYGQDKLYMTGKELKDDEKYKTKYQHYNEMIGTEADKKTESQAKKVVIQEALKCLTGIREMGVTLPTARDLIKEAAKSEGHELLGDSVYYDYVARFERAEKEHMQEVSQEMIKKGRELEVFYITGKGGTGKTTLANAIAGEYADRRGIHMAAAPSDNKTYDFTSTYNYEQVTVINEAKGGLFNPREFMNNFDHHNYSPISSRNNDTHWLAKACLFTTSLSFEQFREDTFKYSKGGKDYFHEDVDGNEVFRKTDKIKDELFQFTRRVSYVVEIEKAGKFARFDVYAFDEKKKGFCFMGDIIERSDFYSSELRSSDLAQKIINLAQGKEGNEWNGKVKKDDCLDQKEEDIYIKDKPKKDVKTKKEEVKKEEIKEVEEVKKVEVEKQKCLKSELLNSPQRLKDAYTTNPFGEYFGDFRPTYDKLLTLKSEAN